MKKISTMAFVLALCANANADTTLKMLSFGSAQGPGIGEPGMMGFGISPNGKYVCGAIEYGAGIFIGDLENDNMIYQISDGIDGGQLMNVNNEGEAIGFDGEPGITFNIDGIETFLQVSDEFKYVVGQDISDDGSVAVGLLVGEGSRTYPGYSKNGGLWQLLPIPDIDMGAYNIKQCGAKYVSTDGRIILGYLGAMGPATLWRLNDNGEYVPDPIFDEYAKRYKDDEEHPYLVFEPEGMSPDGHYVLIKVGEYHNEIEEPTMAAVYNTETNELEVYDEVQNIDMYHIGFHPIAIANDGTFVGVVGNPAMDLGAFIMKAGETQAEMFIEAFPEYAEVFGILDLTGYHIPSDISADGKRIIGNGWYTADEDPYSSDAFFYFMTYVLEINDTNNVESIDTELNKAFPVAYYTIDGIRIDTPAKGLNIVRMSDGTVHKVLK